ncbi:hypothetical protein Bbelb_389230 [Branchiostoma belcheri]|nr:hypothetical protein Bbelb_389230 [Branchiostoma belcheri]
MSPPSSAGLRVESSVQQGRQMVSLGLHGPRRSPAHFRWPEVNRRAVASLVPAQSIPDQERERETHKDFLPNATTSPYIKHLVAAVAAGPISHFPIDRWFLSPGVVSTAAGGWCLVSGRVGGVNVPAGRAVCNLDGPLWGATFFYWGRFTRFGGGGRTHFTCFTDMKVYDYRLRAVRRNAAGRDGRCGSRSRLTEQDLLSIGIVKRSELSSSSQQGGQCGITPAQYHQAETL